MSTLEALERMVRAFQAPDPDPIVAFATIEQAREVIRTAKE